MEIKSITRIDGKIRIISANFDHERVDDFEDYGLPEVEYLISAFLKHDVRYLKDDSDCPDYFTVDICSYVNYSHISIPSSLIPYKHIYIKKSITTIDYGTYLCIINGSSKFTIDGDDYDRDSIFSWETSKNFAKHFDCKHITEQALEKYAAVVFYRALPFRMEVMVNYRSMDFDLSTKLKNPKHSY